MTPAMKPARRVDSTSQSCSCTSCLYKSESEQPSIRKYVAHGSRIDRLYFGKYIPLRERKLLNRLVRTRAVYDDLRARLISDSTLSLEQNADLRPGKHHRVLKPLDSEKSGAILELVDIIDKGAALDPKKLSECCSCCSCSSKSKILERNKKDRKRKGVYARTYEDETGTGEGFYERTFERKYGKTGETGTGEGAYASYEREYGKTVPERMGERFNKRGVRFKAKHIRSDPCTCTFKFSGLIKKHSKAMFRKIRPLPLEQSLFDAEEQYIVQKSKKQNFARKSFQKYKQLRNKLNQDMRKLNESKANMKQNLQIRAKKSLEQMKQAKNKMKNNIESGVRKSIQVVKGLHSKDKTFESYESPEIETTFKIKKDSIVKFKDYLKRKEMMKDWECDLECEPSICVPEECFKIIKFRRLHNGNRKRDRKQAMKYEIIKREMKVGGTPLSKSNSAIQAENFAITTATHIKKQKPMLRTEDKNKFLEKGFIYESEVTKKEGIKKGMKKTGKKVKKSDKSSLMLAAHRKNDHRYFKEESHIHEKRDSSKEKRFDTKDKPHSRGRQAVRIKSSFSFDVEFYKNPREVKSSLANQHSGIHMHAHRHKHRKVQRGHDKPHIMSKSSLESSKGSLKTMLIQTDNYPKAPLAPQQRQLTSKLSYCECEKRVSDEKTNTDYDTKSVASLTNKSMVATADKNISKKVKQKARLSQVSLLPPARQDTLASEINKSYSYPKQAVRIGSTFSFNIEFYKKNDNNELKPPLIREHVKETRIYNKKNVRQKLVKVKGTSAKAYNRAKITLSRCFCTLKLHEHIKSKKKNKTTKTGTVTCLCETKPLVPSMIDKYVETKKMNRYQIPKLSHLLPYQCEPGVCIPDECDPVLCKKLIDLRKRRFRQRISKSVGSYTDSRKTKSTSSIVSRRFTPDKAKIIQSSIVPTKMGSTNAPRRYKNNVNFSRNELFRMNVNAPERQAVRIGSSFSFNIEFYKDKQNPPVAIANKLSFLSMPPETKPQHKQRKLKDHVNNKRSKSMFTQVITKDKHVGQSLKRCLCTLKLYKNKIPQKKTNKMTTKLTTDTQTFGETSIGESVDRGTKTKKEHLYKLLPYECEPYICVPGECDPYICLEKIKRRELNTRNVSAFTNKPEVRSMSSITENSFKKSEAILVQSKLFRKGTNTKGNYIKPIIDKPRPREENFKASKSRQAVRIGSSFNLSIEFSKKQPGATFNKHPEIHEFSKVHPKINRDKGITVTKVRVGHVDTQALEAKKFNRASLVRPMLKRCFCTLNLQKKTKQHYRKDLTSGGTNFGPKVYTVGRATTTKTEKISHSLGSHINARLNLIEPNNISISTSSFLLNKYFKKLKLKHGTVKVYSTFKMPINSRQPLIIKSNISMKLDVARQLGPCKESKICYINQPLHLFSRVRNDDKSQETLKMFNQWSYKNIKKITDISKYLEQCFCTMNVQISNQRGKAIKKINNGLKPYECEPGICIPGECDPYECKKLIMRRFVKNVRKSSGTNSKSVSSYAEFDSKSTQIQTHPLPRGRSQITKPLKYEPQWQREPKQRQTVRIKSSFSFDLEFYKHRSHPFAKYEKPVETNTDIKKIENRKRFKTTRQGGNQENKYHDKENNFQTIVPSVHRGTTPMSKRCFCTLKLQKKGKIKRKYGELNTLPAKPLSIVSLRNVKIGTTAKYQKVPVDSNDLKLYECEPGICVPGQCDPYKCLELMRHQKELRINTILKEKKSVSSMTSEEKYKNRAIGPKHTKIHDKSTKAIKYLKSTEIIQSHIPARSARPAVRIGSNFSFNIEFFKDVPQIQQYKETNLRKVKISGNDTRQVREGKEIKTILPPSTESISHRDIVTPLKPFNDKTNITTSFMKRCFCTENLRPNKVLNQENKNTFKHKCFCLLGLRSKGNKKLQTTEKLGLQSEKIKPAKMPKRRDIRGNRNRNGQPAKNSVQTAEKPTNTNNRHKVYFPHLEPYECETGLCVPGQCDPHLCEKIIQQRLAKQYSKKSETESIRTQSTSSSFGDYKRSKNERTQARNQTDQKQIQYQSKPIPPSGNIALNADKRLVRLGSNFSFNIEFYKENVNGDVIKKKVTEVKTYPTKNIQPEKKNKANVPKNIATETINVGVRKAQIQKKAKASGISPIIKRCFCTLKLVSKPILKNGRSEKINQLDTKPALPTKSVETQSYKYLKGPLLPNDLDRELLYPYECEPFVCVPGECDPIECLKRIKRRQQQTKESGTITKYPKRKSVGNVATRRRDENVQIRRPGAITNKSVQNSSYFAKFGPEKSYNQRKQAVRIGSNFSFNIEFFKDIDSHFPKTTLPSRPLEELNIEKHSKEKGKYRTKAQSSYIKQKAYMPNKTKQLQTTETAKAHLKRCFCTLPLENKNIGKLENTQERIGSDQPKSDHSSMGSFVKKCLCTLKLSKVGKQQKQLSPPAVKYQIKGTSTKDWRAQQVGMKKPFRTLEPYECEPYVCVPGECDPYECLKRIQRRQVRDCGTDYKRHVKDSATDSIKQTVTRSIKAQYDRKRKLSSRGTSLTMKRKRHSKDLAQFSLHPSHNANRQVVRIGSNFSFNVEFFKDNVLPNTELEEQKVLKSEKSPNINALQFKRPDKVLTKSKGSIGAIKRLRNKYSQCSYPKRQVLYPTANVAPKRCFCTLSLLKKPHLISEGKQVPPITATKNKMTTTKVKYTLPQKLDVYECPPLMCIPGQCNPYECLEKIKKREIMSKSRNVGTRAAKTSIASVGNRGFNQKVHKVQSQVGKKRNAIAYAPRSEPQSEILKSSRTIENSDRRKKRAVRIGSNFNFNVEFFKQKSQPAVITVPKIVRAKENKDNSKSYENKNVTAGPRNLNFKASIDHTKLKDQGSDAGNLLKRCFCTLQLQKPTHKKNARVKIHRPGNNVRYPQIFTVGRVAVEPFLNTTMKTSSLKKTEKARSTSIDSKLINRTVGTRTNEKYLRNGEFSSSQCNPNNCPEYQKRFFRRKIENDMHTILPYTPSKFNKKESRTLLSDKNKLKHNHVTSHNPSDTSILSKGKRRLTAKKSNKSIPTKSLQTESNFKSSFFCRCARFFSRKSEGISETGKQKQKNITKTNNLPNQSAEIKLTIPPKNEIRLKKNCPFACPENSKETGRRYLKLQNGDTEHSYDISKSQEGEKTYKHRTMKVTFADTSENSKNKMLKSKTNKSIHSKSSIRSRLCYSCSVNDCPRNFNNVTSKQQKSDNNRLIGKSMKNNKKAVSYSESADDCQYCDCCKRKIHMDEISKGGGDRRLTISSQYKGNTNTCPCGRKSIISENGRIPSLREKLGEVKLSQKMFAKTDKCCSKIKPLLEMRLDSIDQDIINKGEVKKIINQLSINSRQVEDIKSSKNKIKQHNACICCKCKRKREMQGAKISVAAKGAYNVLGKFGKMFPTKSIKTKAPTNQLKTISTKPRSKYPNPCICGSKKCAMDSKRKRKGKGQKEKIKLGKSCICGSSICFTESRRLKREKQRIVNKAKRKAHSLAEKQESKAVNRRVKIQEEKDYKRRLKRIKRNKELEERVKKYKNASDVMLAVDSLADIGKLGFSTLTGALHYTTKSFVDPKVACERLCKRCRKKDPETLRKQLLKDYSESDTAATLRRLKMRCLFMKRVQTLKEKLEENPVTHFILHLADKNPKTRQFKRKPVRRVREPLDFQCSLYMSTLRKRPYLFVYYKWPWFYPHFMTMLNIWRQFTDIMLFLLAAVVWSPCILCMEGCRALMCCFFCTG